MAEILKERCEIESEYTWDLQGLYKSEEEFERELKSFDGQLERLKTYSGTLHTAENIRSYLDAETAMERVISNLYSYAHLRKSEDTRAKEAQSMYARAYAKYVNALSIISFAEPEILSLSQEKLLDICQDEKLKPYEFRMKKLQEKKEHMLSANEEKLLADFGETFASSAEIAKNLMDADMVFASIEDKEGKSIEVTGANFISLQTGLDRDVRKKAFLSFYKGYKQHINTFAAAYAGKVKAITTEARVRNYDSSRAMSMAEEGVPTKVYDTLIDTVNKHLPTMYRYLAFRKRLLGVDSLHYYDVYAPLVQTEPKEYSYEDAKEMVLDAVYPLGEEYHSIVAKGFADRWVDVYPNKGKSGGAYSSGTYDSNPYIMMNFTGSLDSVSTLAHEMGHSMHTWFANQNQEAQNASYTLFVAEVASTVNENLMIEQLLKKCKDSNEKLALLNQYLESFKGTVYRQTMFAEFEKEVHAMAERGEAIIADSLNTLYKNLIEKYFGPDLVLDEEVQYEWARIPHFYRPFYVYKYATSYSSAVALSEKILAGNKEDVRRYLEFLSMGGSQNPLDELKHAGVDLTDAQAIDMALKKFADVLAMAEEVAKSLGR